MHICIITSNCPKTKRVTVGTPPEVKLHRRRPSSPHLGAARLLPPPVLWPTQPCCTPPPVLVGRDARRESLERHHRFRPFPRPSVGWSFGHRTTVSNRGRLASGRTPNDWRNHLESRLHSELPALGRHDTPQVGRTPGSPPATCPSQRHS